MEREAAAGCFFEGWIGGRVYETLRNGSLHLWGTVTAWDPPKRIVFSWHPPGREAATAQEVERRFIPLEAGTRVELVHRGWELLGKRGLALRDACQSGWVGVLSRYVARCAGPGAP